MHELEIFQLYSICIYSKTSKQFSKSFMSPVQAENFARSRHKKTAHPTHSYSQFIRLLISYSRCLQWLFEGLVKKIESCKAIETGFDSPFTSHKFKGELEISPIAFSSDANCTNVYYYSNVTELETKYIPMPRSDRR